MTNKKSAAVAPLKLLKPTPANLRKTAAIASAPTPEDYPIPERRTRKTGLSRI